VTLVGSFDYCRVRLILIHSSPHNLEHVAELCIKMEPSTVLDDGTKYSRHVVDVLRLSLTLVSRYPRYGTAVHTVLLILTMSELLDAAGSSSKIGHIFYTRRTSYRYKN
jgi:hypothetical protein